MHQSSSFTSWGLDRNWKTGMQLVQVFCICTQSHHKVKLTAVYWRGVGSTQCLYNNGRLFLPSTPICNHRETVITFNITYAHFNGVAFTTSYFKDKAHKVLHQIFAIVSFFSILFHFFPSFFFFSEKRGDCDDDAADW